MVGFTQRAGLSYGQPINEGNLVFVSLSQSLYQRRIVFCQSARPLRSTLGYMLSPTLSCSVNRNATSLIYPLFILPCMRCYPSPRRLGSTSSSASDFKIYLEFRCRHCTLIALISSDIGSENLQVFLGQCTVIITAFCLFAYRMNLVNYSKLSKCWITARNSGSRIGTYPMKVPTLV